MSFRKKGALSYILAFLIALSRVFIGVHYLTDILAGMMLGTLTAIGLFYLCEFILKKFNNRKQKPTE
jgi:undecaprenyl-diphosphatase